MARPWPAPPPRDHHAAVAVAASRMFIFGGISSTGAQLDDIAILTCGGPSTECTWEIPKVSGSVRPGQGLSLVPI